MRFRRQFRIICLSIAGLCLLMSQHLASAQSEARLRISKPFIDQFPHISLYLSLLDDDGRHIPRLTAENFIPIEDGVTLDLDDLAEITIGTRQLFILNTTRALRGRDALGWTRFDYIREALLDWWGKDQSAKIGLDDLSLISLEGPLVLNSRSAAQLASAIAAYEPALDEDQTSYRILLEGLAAISGPAPHAGMTTSVIFITPFVDDASDLPLTDTIARAKEAGISIHTILVGTEDLLDYPQVENLRLLSQATGGEMFLFSAEEGLAPYMERLLTQRTLYELSFTSRAKRSGSHEIQIRLIADALDLISNSARYEIEVLPAEVLFIRPPSILKRHTEDPTLAPEDIPPQASTLKVLINFPDGHPRSVVSSSLSVDGQIVARRFEAPFDTFVWDISSYRETGAHRLQVFVEDTLGLQGQSDEIAVTVDISFPQPAITSLQPALIRIVMVVVVLALGVACTFALISLGRRHRLKSAPHSQISAKKEDHPRRASLRRPDRSQAEAVLKPLQHHVPPVNLVGTDILLGRDGALSTVALDDPSLSPIHARFVRLASGDYLLRDQGSIAGTWVNYQLVTEKGQVLRHGDLIHLGRIAYRFELTHPPLDAHQIHLRPYDPFRLTDIPETQKQEARA